MSVRHSVSQTTAPVSPRPSPAVCPQQTANLVRLLVRVTPDPAVNGVIEYVDQLLDNAAFLTVTVNEVEVMRYTGGGLYNKAVVDKYVVPAASSTGRVFSFMTVHTFSQLPCQELGGFTKIVTSHFFEHCENYTCPRF